jgi:hypothetical protein
MRDDTARQSRLVTGILSPEAVTRLLSDGWNPRSASDIGTLTEFLRAEGYVVSADAAAVLSGLNGTRVTSAGRIDFEFGVNKALSSLPEGSATLIRNFFGEAVCPVGHGRGLALLIGEFGRSLLLDDQWRGYITTTDTRTAVDWAVLGLSTDSMWVELDDRQVPYDFGGFNRPEGAP